MAGKVDGLIGCRAQPLQRAMIRDQPIPGQPVEPQGHVDPLQRRVMQPAGERRDRISSSGTGTTAGVKNSILEDAIAGQPAACGTFFERGLGIVAAR